MGGHESCPPSGVGPLFGHVPPGVWEGVGPRTQGWTMSPQRGDVLKQYRMPSGAEGDMVGDMIFVGLLWLSLEMVGDHVPPAVWGDMFDGPLASISLERAEFCSLARVAPVIPNCEE